jgi:tight adherence protein B
MNGSGFLLLGVASLFFLAGIGFLASGGQRRRNQQMQDRLEELQGLSTPSPVSLSRNRFVASERGGPQFLELWLARADIALRPQIVLAAGCALLAVASILTLLAGPIVGCVIAAIVLGGGIFGLRLLAARRIAAFINGLPFFLDALRQLLTVGNSMQQALLTTAENSGPEMQRYLNPLIRRINNGAPIPESIRWLADRLKVPELYMLAAAVETNFRFGGRMSTVLANLVHILRDGARVGRELRSATAEIRFSAIVLGLMPFAAAAMIGITKPSYIMFFIETAQGHRLALIALGLQAAGLLVMSRIMRLEF